MSSPELPQDRPLRVLGIEGTAWAASAALFETADPTERQPGESIVVESDPYQPDSGGIHPREAAEHMADAIPEVVEEVLAVADDRVRDADDGTRTDETDGGANGAEAYSEGESPIDAVAFSRGPGLGPCLRIVATAARAVAQRFDVPLVGVNHMVAHLEIGRHCSGFDDPICLNASGANAHVLGLHGGRYRVLGETMDAGVGNAIDKFTRHVGWSHPGGPKVEERALEGDYVHLPYVVKGMDFSFSGISSAAKQAYDDGVPVEDVCRGLQETVFAMLTEVAERALSLTGRDELVLGGGVGQNDRLREMLETMCEQRGAKFYAPEARFLRDNAGMIAVLGAKMYAAGDTVAIEDSRVDADFRPDQVPVTWREGRTAVARPTTDDGLVQGAEAVVGIEDGVVTKERRPREYRHPQLDERLRGERTRREARAASEARRHGVPTPVIRDVDPATHAIKFQAVGATDLKADLREEYVAAVGRHLATLHDAGLVHGDPTVRNVRVGTESAGEASADAPRTFLIDFGLSYDSRDAEDHAMDVHVFAQSLAGVAADADALIDAATAAYRETSDHATAVFERLGDIEGRGRYQ